jgi:hypothetical protein
MAGRQVPTLRDAVERTAAQLSDALRGESITIQRSELPAVWDAAVRGRGALLPLAVLGVGGVLAAAALHPRWNVAVVWTGATLLAGGLALALGGWAAPSLVRLGGTGPLEASAGAFVDGVNGGLDTQSLVIDASGLVMSEAAVLAGVRPSRPQPVDGSSTGLGVPLPVRQ